MTDTHGVDLPLCMTDGTGARRRCWLDSMG